MCIFYPLQLPDHNLGNQIIRNYFIMQFLLRQAVSSKRLIGHAVHTCPQPSCPLR